MIKIIPAPLAAGAGAGGGNPFSYINIIAGTITTDTSQLTTTVTRNASGVTFGAAWKLIITDTASAAGSLAMQVLGGSAGSTSLFSVDKNGLLSAGSLTVTSSTQPVFGAYLGAASQIYWRFSSNDSYRFLLAQMDFCSNAFLSWNSTVNTLGGAADVSFFRSAAGVMAIGSGGNSGFAGRLKLTSEIIAAVAVGSLNASPTIGEVQTVNDALAVTAKGATVSAGGSAVCQVMWNGSNWVGT